VDQSSLRRDNAQQWHDIPSLSVTKESSNKSNKTLGASLGKRKFDSDSSKEEKLSKDKKGLFLECEAERDQEMAQKLIRQKFASKKKIEARKPEKSGSSIAVTRPESQNSNMSWIEGEEPHVLDRRDVELSVSAVLHGAQQPETSTVATLLHSFQQLATPMATPRHSSQQSSSSFASASKFYGSRAAKDQTKSNSRKQSTSETLSKKGSESRAGKKSGSSQKNSRAVTNVNAQQNVGGSVQRSDSLMRNTRIRDGDKDDSSTVESVISSSHADNSALINAQAACNSKNTHSSFKSDDSHSVIDWSSCVVVIERKPQLNIGDAAERDAKKSDSGTLVNDTTLTNTSVQTTSRVVAHPSEAVIREGSAVPITMSRSMQGLDAKVTAGSFEGQGHSQEPNESSTDVLVIESFSVVCCAGCLALFVCSMLGCWLNDVVYILHGCWDSCNGYSSNCSASLIIAHGHCCL
jgi:hypothetical protein